MGTSRGLDRAESATELLYLAQRRSQQITNALILGDRHGITTALLGYGQGQRIKKEYKRLYPNGRIEHFHIAFEIAMALFMALGVVF